jgi:hypothetical protein
MGEMSRTYRLQSAVGTELDRHRDVNNGRPAIEVKGGNQITTIAKPQF